MKAKNKVIKGKDTDIKSKTDQVKVTSDVAEAAEAKLIELGDKLKEALVERDARITEEEAQRRCRVRSRVIFAMLIGVLNMLILL